MKKVCKIINELDPDLFQCTECHKWKHVDNLAYNGRCKSCLEWYAPASTTSGSSDYKFKIDISEEVNMMCNRKIKIPKFNMLRNISNQKRTRRKSFGRR